MTSKKALVLDANILIRAVLGRRVRQILRKYANEARFCAPEVCFIDARKYIATLSERHKKMDRAQALAFLTDIESIVQSIPANLYHSYEARARRRIERRDPDDWPIVAAALLFNCPIWTEDMDFFGAGIGTWTTDRVEIYLKPPEVSP
jgi:predicted nucleic acid-binding protein